MFQFLFMVNKAHLPRRWGILKEPKVSPAFFIQSEGVQIGEEGHPHLFIGQVKQGFEAPALQLEPRFLFLPGRLAKVDDSVPEAVSVFQQQINSWLNS